MASDTTQLKRLLVEAHLQRYETFCREYQKVAIELSGVSTVTVPSRSQFFRWLAGDIKQGKPHPDACRVLERMFHPWSATDLFDHRPADTAIPARSTDTNKTTNRNLFALTHEAFPAQSLVDYWLATFEFTHNGQVHCHFDISEVSAVSDREITITTRAAHSEGRARPFRNLIHATVVGRHVIGSWRNISDTRYFGAVHLAVQPERTVMAGHFTALNSDVDVIAGPWRWLRIAPPLTTVLTDRTLRDPTELHELAAAQTAYHPALTWQQVLDPG